MRELDPETITFPPLELGFRREAAGLSVEADLADLRKDSDSDGLTDLVEARLLTNPTAADTDGDGLSDRDDAFPSVPSGAEKGTDSAALLSAVLAQVLESDRPTAQVVGTRGGMFEKAVGRRAPIPLEATTFLIGEPAEFVGVRSSRRVIILSVEEALRVSKQQGLIFPMRLEIVSDQAGKRAHVLWHESWRGGSFDAHLVRGKWVFSSVTYSIS